MPKEKGLSRARSSLGESSPRSPTLLQNVPFIAVTSFLCLRFFSPAIMAPKLFHLRERHADARTSRTLLLLAKVWLHPRAGMPSQVLNRAPCLDCIVFPTGSRKAS